MVLAFAGIFIAGVLSVGHAMNVTVPCGAGQTGCATIAAHPSSLWFGVPVAYFGLGAYAFFAALALLRSVAANADQYRLLVRVGFILSGVGTLLSLYLTYVALAVVQATCPWCLASAGTMILTFLVHGMLGQREDTPITANRLDTMLVPALAVVAIGAVAVQARNMEAAQADAGISARALGAVSVKDLVPDRATPTLSRHMVGPEDAPITVVEFADIFCAHCRRNFSSTKEIVSQFPGKVRMVFRHFPLYMREDHAFSLPAAMLAEYAADHGKFWEYMDMVMNGEQRLVESDTGLLRIIDTLGLDTAEARRVLTQTEGPYFDRVFADIALASMVGVERTPTFLVFGTEGPPRATTPAGLPGVVERLLKEIDG